MRGEASLRAASRSRLERQTQSIRQIESSPSECRIPVLELESIGVPRGRARKPKGSRGCSEGCLQSLDNCLEDRGFVGLERLEQICELIEGERMSERVTERIPPSV